MYSFCRDEDKGAEDRELIADIFGSSDEEEEFEVKRRNQTVHIVLENI